MKLATVTLMLFLDVIFIFCVGKKNQFPVKSERVSLYNVSPLCLYSLSLPRLTEINYNELCVMAAGSDGDGGGVISIPVTSHSTHFILYTNILLVVFVPCSPGATPRLIPSILWAGGALSLDYSSPSVPLSYWHIVTSVTIFLSFSKYIKDALTSQSTIN